MKQNQSKKNSQVEGSQKEDFEGFHLEYDEFDPYAIVILSQLWRILEKRIAE